jgi:hypothetical protein
LTFDHPDKLDIFRKAFTDPDRLRPGQIPSQVTEEAARHFARLAQILRRYGNEPHATAHFLIRLRFCLFAEDVGILPDGLFTKLVTQPHKTTGAVSSQLRQLFAAMASGGSFGADEIPLVDGGLFNDDSTLDLDGDSLHILAEVSGLDWSSVEPSVLGTLFVRSLDPDKRSQLGAHYTCEADILLIVEPVLMAPLRRRWGEVKAEAKAAKRDPLAGSKPSTQKSRQLAGIEAELFGLLRRFREELAAVQVLAAACGSGNFLYVALRLLLDLEWEVITATPEVAKHRIFVWMPSEVLCNQQTLVSARADDYFYTPTTTFETFPFLWPPGREPVDDPRVQAIAAAAADLVAKRDAWLNPTGASDAERKQRTLTNLYNARPAWLDLAHRALDAAVLAAYGWPRDLTDDEILARLLALNLARRLLGAGRKFAPERDAAAELIQERATEC